MGGHDDGTRRALIAVLLSAGLAACIDRKLEIPEAPKAPQATVDATSCFTPIVVAGTKPAGTSVWMDGARVVPADASTTFSIQVDLEEGPQSFSLTTKDDDQLESDPLDLESTLVLAHPAAPIVTGETTVRDGIKHLPDSTSDVPYRLGGTVGPDADGVAVYDADGEEIARVAPSGAAFEVQIGGVLVDGPNRWDVRSFDACRESDPDPISIFHDSSGVGLSIDPYETLQCADRAQLSGWRADRVDIVIDGRTVAPWDADPSPMWSIELALEEGANSFEVIGRKPDGRQSVPRTVAVFFDDTPPAAPTIDPVTPLVNEPTYDLSGAKEPSSGVMVDAQMMVPVDEQSSFSVNVGLSDGANQLGVRAFDACGRTSDEMAVRIELDTIAPSATIVSPETEETVVGTIDITGTASDNRAVAAIQIFVDGLPLGAPIATSTVFRASWDTLALQNGWYEIAVEATDEAGNVSLRDARRVQVQNLELLVSTEPALSAPDLADLAQSLRPSVAALSDGSFAVAWDDNQGLSGTDRVVNIRMYRSDGSLLSEERLSTPGFRAQGVRLSSTTNLGIHAVWQELRTSGTGLKWRVLHRRYVGGTWEPAAIVSGTSDGYESYNPDVDYRSGAAHIVWEDNGDRDGDGSSGKDIYYSRGSTTFLPPALVSVSSPTDSTRPAVAVTGDKCAHVAWMENTGGRNAIFYSGAVLTTVTQTLNRSTLPGEEEALTEQLPIEDREDPRPPITTCRFQAPLELTQGMSFTEASGPTIAVGPGVQGKIYTGFEVTWAARTDAYVRRVTAATLSTPVLLSDAPDFLEARGVRARFDTLGRLHVVFAGRGNVAGTGADWDIFSRIVENNTPQALVAISDRDADQINRGDSLSPAVATTTTARSFVTWQDDSDYDRDGVADDDVILLIR